MEIEYQRLNIESVDVYEVACCPFCMSPNIIVQDSVPLHSNAFCKDCGARGPTEYSVSGAINEWNKRGGSEVYVDEFCEEQLQQCQCQSEPKWIKLTKVSPSGKMFSCRHCGRVISAEGKRFKRTAVMSDGTFVDIEIVSSLPGV